jgi:hypothetical protein
MPKPSQTRPRSSPIVAQNDFREVRAFLSIFPRGCSIKRVEQDCQGRNEVESEAVP